MHFSGRIHVTTSRFVGCTLFPLPSIQPFSFGQRHRSKRSRHSRRVCTCGPDSPALILASRLRILASLFAGALPRQSWFARRVSSSNSGITSRPQFATNKVQKVQAWSRLTRTPTECSFPGHRCLGLVRRQRRRWNLHLPM